MKTELEKLEDKIHKLVKDYEKKEGVKITKINLYDKNDITLADLKKIFRCLRHWHIRLVKSKKYSGFTSIDTDNKRAIIYDWHNKDKPGDFDLHELLHCAFAEILSMDKRKKRKLFKVEEELVQDICAIYSRL